MGETDTKEAETRHLARRRASSVPLRTGPPAEESRPDEPQRTSGTAPKSGSVRSRSHEGELEQPEPPDRYDLAMRRVGNVLGGKWTLDGLLGLGGMAAVYAATHRNGARAAIKLLPFSIASGPELCQRLLREGYLANKIHHTAVVRVLDDHIDYEQEHAYIVMELLTGETTRQRIDRAGTFEPLQAIELMIELCGCLRAAHSASVVHRDIKPENLFLTNEGLKVLDFGIARAIDVSSSLTQTGTSLGTPAYMSPEQARGKQNELTPRSDLYSVGATLLFLLTGETMHEGDSAMELMVRAAWTPPPRAKKRCSSLPNSIADVIDRCCAFDPEARYPDADAVIAALESVARHLASTPPPPIHRLVLAPPEPGKAPVDLLSETIETEGSPKPSLTMLWLWLLPGTLLAFALTFYFIGDTNSETPPTNETLPVPAAEKPRPKSEVATASPEVPPDTEPSVPGTDKGSRNSSKRTTVPELSAPPRLPRQKNIASEVSPPPKQSEPPSGQPSAETPWVEPLPPPPAAAPPKIPRRGGIDINYDGLNEP